MARKYKYITKNEIIRELQTVAKMLHAKTVSRAKFKKYGTIPTATIEKKFGNWSAAIAAANLIPIPKNHSHLPCDPSPRKTLRTRTKLAVIRRDRYKCCLCGKSPATDETVNLHFDHIRPLALGGTDSIFNIWLLCSHCNQRKGITYTSDLIWFSAVYLATRLLEKTS